MSVVHAIRIAETMMNSHGADNAHRLATKRWIDHLQAVEQEGAAVWAQVAQAIRHLQMASCE